MSGEGGLVYAWIVRVARFHQHGELFFGSARRLRLGMEFGVGADFAEAPEGFGGREEPCFVFAVREHDFAREVTGPLAGPGAHHRSGRSWAVIVGVKEDQDRVGVGVQC